MARVQIGHAASPDGGVKFSNWWDDGWTVLLRPDPNKVDIEKSINLCVTAINNNNIKYSQGYRNTFKEQALAAAGFGKNENNKLKYVTPEHVKKITTTCYCDCSSFMTFCAIAAGAVISYGTNAPRTATMRSPFTEAGAYKAITASSYLRGTTYLRRGDILVAEGKHTVMVLGNGANGDKEYTDDPNQILSSGGQYISTQTWADKPSTTNIHTTLTAILPTEIKGEVQMIRRTNGEEKIIKTTNSYAWQYDIRLLDTNKKIDFGSLTPSSNNKVKINCSKLYPGNSYILKIIAKEGSSGQKFKASNVIFTTPLIYPSTVNDLSVKLSADGKLPKNFELSFTAPTTWPVTRFKKCYRLVLLVNGKPVAYNDTILKAGSSYSGKKINIDQITSKNNIFTFNDFIQIGIYPGFKDSEDNFICNPKSFKCSKRFFIKNPLNTIDKLHIKIKDTFNRVILYNKR